MYVQFHSHKFEYMHMCQRISTSAYSQQGRRYISYPSWIQYDQYFIPFIYNRIFQQYKGRICWYEETIWWYAYSTRQYDDIISRRISKSTQRFKSWLIPFWTNSYYSHHSMLVLTNRQQWSKQKQIFWTYTITTDSESCHWDLVYNFYQLVDNVSKND